MCQKELHIGKATYFCIVEKETHEGSHNFLIPDTDVDMVNTAQPSTQAGDLKLVRVYEESEVEEVAVGEYRLKKHRR